MGAITLFTPNVANSQPSPVLVRPYRALVGVLPNSLTGATFTIQADATISEEHLDEMVVTDNPVEAGTAGAVVTDHAYRLPSELVLVYVWSPASKQNTTQDVSFLNSLYAQFLSVMANKVLLQVFTGKRQYINMLIRSIAETTDDKHENILLLRISLREILIATTQTITLSANIGAQNNQSTPQQSAPIVPQGPVALTPGNNFSAAGLTQGLQ